MDNHEKPPLGEQVGMRVATVATKGALGAIPLFGGLAAELAGQIIPQQRMDRIEAFLRYLDLRLDGLSRETLQEKLEDPERLDIFEEGASQTTRALSDARREYIANIVARGITGDDRTKIEAKRLLRLLGDIDDDQVIILTSKLRRHQFDTVFSDRHDAVLRPVSVHMGSSREEHDQAALYELARVELVRLGLLAPTFKATKRGELPEFDPKTGMMKQSSRTLTPLGRMLLRFIALAAEDEI
jgi:hypothetical protein